MSDTVIPVFFIQLKLKWVQILNTPSIHEKYTLSASQNCLHYTWASNLEYFRLIALDNACKLERPNSHLVIVKFMIINSQ